MTDMRCTERSILTTTAACARVASAITKISAAKTQYKRRMACLGSSAHISTMPATRLENLKKWLTSLEKRSGRFPASLDLPKPGFDLFTCGVFIHCLRGSAFVWTPINHDLP